MSILSQLYRFILWPVEIFLFSFKLWTVVYYCTVFLLRFIKCWKLCIRHKKALTLTFSLLITAVSCRIFHIHYSLTLYILWIQLTKCHASYIHHIIVAERTSSKVIPVHPCTSADPFLFSYSLLNIYFWRWEIFHDASLRMTFRSQAGGQRGDEMRWHKVEN